MKKLSKDIICYIGLKLDLPDVLSLGMTCKKFNVSICENRYFWMTRLRSDYDINYLTIKPIDPKKYYRFVINYDNLSSDNQLNKLYYAAKNRSLDIIKLLIKNGVTDWNYGLWGAAEGGHKDIVKLMIKKGVTSWSPGLAGAAEGGHIDIVQLMIEKGANNWNGGLHNAALGGHIDIVELMIKMGANDWHWGLSGARKGGHKDIIKIMEDKIKERGY